MATFALSVSVTAAAALHAAPGVSIFVGAELAMYSAAVAATGAPAVTAAATNAVVAMLVSLSLAVGVGAFGSPVNVGEAFGA
ncbi:MAG: hypothetical protein WCF47_17195 [Pseudolabrys sp.]